MLIALFILFGLQHAIYCKSTVKAPEDHSANIKAVKNNLKANNDDYLEVKDPSGLNKPNVLPGVKDKFAEGKDIGILGLKGDDKGAPKSPRVQSGANNNALLSGKSAADVFKKNISFNDEKPRNAIEVTPPLQGASNMPSRRPRHRRRHRQHHKRSRLLRMGQQDVAARAGAGEVWNPGAETGEGWNRGAGTGEHWYPGPARQRENWNMGAVDRKERRNRNAVGRKEGSNMGAGSPGETWYPGAGRREGWKRDAASPGEEWDRGHVGPRERGDWRPRAQDMQEEVEAQIPDPNKLDMGHAIGSRVLALRSRGRLCSRSMLYPEGPKYESNGATYAPADPTGAASVRDFAATKPHHLLLPKCCNCCKKSVLGCE